MSRERYVRAVVKAGDVELIAGLAFRNEELAKMPDGLSQDDFFLECGYQAETEGWVQVFEPYGAPLSMVGRLRKWIGW